MKSIILFATLFLLNTCNKSNQLDTFVNEEGAIKAFVCSRGCYQYLLDHNGSIYFPGELPENLKQDGVKVVFSGKLKHSETAINKPGPNDAPVFDFNAQDIHITDIKAK